MKIVTTFLELPLINDGLFTHVYQRNIHPFPYHRNCWGVGEE